MGFALPEKRSDYLLSVLAFFFFFFWRGSDIVHNDQQPTKAALMFVLAAVIVVHMFLKSGFLWIWLKFCVYCFCLTMHLWFVSIC